VTIIARHEQTVHGHQEQMVIGLTAHVCLALPMQEALVRHIKAAVRADHKAQAKDVLKAVDMAAVKAGRKVPAEAAHKAADLAAANPAVAVDLQAVPAAAQAVARQWVADRLPVVLAADVKTKSKNRSVPNHPKKISVCNGANNSR